MMWPGILRRRDSLIHSRTSCGRRPTLEGRPGPILGESETVTTANFPTGSLVGWAAMQGFAGLGDSDHSPSFSLKLAAGLLSGASQDWEMGSEGRDGGDGGGWELRVV